MINSSIDRPHTQESIEEPKFLVEVIDNQDTLLDLEVQRVSWYLSNFSVYQKQGYAAILRWPDNIDPRDKHSNVQLRKAIKQEMDRNMDQYRGFADRFDETIDSLLSTTLPVIKELYGISLDGSYSIAPSAYGTIAGQIVTDGPIFFRFPQYHPETLGQSFSTGSYRTDAELITHEILAHGATAHLRDGTAIDESNPKCSHQRHKEYLMDSLGRTILTRSSIMHADDIAMQIKPMQIAQADIDPLYYGADGNLSWEGNLRGLIEKIDLELNRVK